ncbi:hypothetical protein AB0M28_11660 [Streptomyces sp. NPDC051940]|uniref:hypothetical protein n=1 Tax=Streptomyces sp. NPDC051940 TaxID=3155675 RepID=UPI003449423A
MRTTDRLLAVSVARGRPGPDAVGTRLGPGDTVAVVRVPHDHAYAEPSADDLRGRILSGKGLAELAAPYAAVAAEEGAVTVAADALGLRQTYGVQGDGWAAVGTSARALARLAGAPLDHSALGGYRLCGHFLQADTAFTGVRRLRAGHRWRLADGRLTELAGPAGETATVAVHSVDDAVRDVAALLRGSLERLLDEHPDAVLELSGGLGSRLILAAVPPARRAGLRVLTLRGAGTGDAEVAGRLVARYRMRHQVIDTARLGRLVPSDVHRLVNGASLRYEQIHDLVRLALLDWVERQTDSGPRVGAWGGELLRGPGYARQPAAPRVTAELVERFAESRLFTRDALDGAALDPRLVAESRRETVRRLQDVFAGFGGDWLRATDAYHAQVRLPPVTGSTLTAASLDHRVLAPLLDPRLLAVADALPPSAKRGSRFIARVLTSLDPELAAAPLDSGTRPRTLTHPLAKLLTTRRRAQPGAHGAAPTLTAALLAHWRATPGLLDPLFATDLVSARWLQDALDARTDPRQATVAYLALLEAALTES